MTLVEMLAVVVILGLIAGTLLAGFSGSFAKARHELARAAIGHIVNKLELYQFERGTFPSNEQGLSVLTEGHANPSAPYFLSPGQLLDPWKRTYLYINPGPSGHPYEVLSLGADGLPGGEPGTPEEDVSSCRLSGVFRPAA